MVHNVEVFIFLPPSPCLYFSAHVGNDGSSFSDKYVTIRLAPALQSCFPSFPPPPLLFLTPTHSLILCYLFFLFSRTPPSFGRGWEASGHPASPGTGCGSESGTHPWSKRRRAKWCGSGTDGSCKTKPLWRDREKIQLHKLQIGRNTRQHLSDKGSRFVVNI